MSVCYFTFFAKAQQQSQYSQYLYNLLVVNPAYAGSKKALSANLYYRAQWLGFEGAPVTQNFSIHSPLQNKNIGLGLTLSNERIGARNITGGSFAYSYKIPLGKGKLAFGLRTGLYNYQYNWEKLEYKETGDPVTGNFDNNKLVFIADFGLMFYNKNSFAGIEISQLNTPEVIANDYAESSLNRQITAIAGKAFKISNDIAIKPSFLLRYAEGAPAQFDLNMGVLLHKKLWLSGSYRYKFGYVAMAQVYITPAFSLGYSYDIASNSLRANQAGSHEVFLGYDFSIFKSPIQSPRYF